MWHLFLFDLKGWVTLGLWVGVWLFSNDRSSNKNTGKRTPCSHQEKKYYEQVVVLRAIPGNSQGQNS